MATLDIFNGDAFSVSSLSETIVDIPRVPTLIGDMGLFRESGMTTLHTMIERTGSELSLVPTAPRGGVAQNSGSGQRKLVTVSAVHLPKKDTILADQVQGVRAFGSETEVQGVMELVNEKLVQHRSDLDLTLEYHRIGAIKGQVLDADGSSVLLDMYSVMGFNQQVINCNIATPSTTVDPVTLIQTIDRGIKAKLGGRSYTGITVLCSLDWFDCFTKHDNVKAAFADFQGNVYLRTDHSKGDFQFGNCTFKIYEGGTAGNDFIAAGEAYAFPTGVSDLFITKWAPGNLMSVVNTMGRQFYVSQEPLPHGIGVEIFTQSNWLNFCKYPEAVLKLRKQAS